MIAIAASELRMLVRNRLVALAAIIIPLGIGALLVWRGAGDGPVGVLAVFQVIVMVAMGVYVTATTTLAARRQTLFLKRLRSGAVGDGAILGGLLGPIVLVSVVQVVAILAVLAATSSPPQHLWLLIVAVALAEGMFVMLALATAGVTNSPEHAQFTTLPLFLVAVGAAVWVVGSAPGELAWAKLALPGGAIAELIVVGWNGGDQSLVPAAVAAAGAWTLVSGVIAGRMLRWEPRR